MTSVARRLLWVMAVLISIVPVRAMDGASLKGAMASLESARLDTTKLYTLTGSTISSYDMVITFDSGHLAFFEPLVLDSVSHIFAAYFVGSGHFKYRPTPPIERAQISRFFHSDSLNESFSYVILLLGDSALKQLQVQLPTSAVRVDKEFAGSATERYKDAVRFSDRPFTYGLLASLIGQSQNDYIYAYMDPTSGTDIMYCYDPAKREQVNFFKRHWSPGNNYFELLCSYAKDAIDITTTLNGKPLDLIKTQSYAIDATIGEKGEYSGKVEVKFEVLLPLSMLEFALHSMLSVDSVTDSAGAVAFGRYPNDKYWYPALYLYFNSPLQAGQQHAVTVWSHGDISKRHIGEFYVTAGAGLYPRYGFKQAATFDFQFKTPKRYTFVAAGKSDHRKVVGDTLESHWVIDEPTDNVSFSIGNIKKYEFSDTLAGSVDVYYSEALHRDLASELAQMGEVTGSHMEKQVSGDVINALRLFSHQFGRYPYGRMSVSEILALHGESFPGFIHMGIGTWMNTDRWGYEQMFRSHEVAHQWWGVGVGYETYHDQWLSEGFAEYSALMYLQAVKGNESFLDRMKEYGKEVVAVREKPSDSSSETGPVIMGFRTSSTKSEGDAGLIIYKKGALVLHMIRNLLIDWRTLNEDKFFAMMKEWYSTSRGRAVSTEDFMRLTEKYAREDMTWFFDQWVYGTEIPTYKFTYEIEPAANNTFVVKGRVTTLGVSPNFRMYVPLEIRIDDKRKAFIRVLIEGPESSFSLPGLPVKPKEIKLNPYESVLAEVKQ